MELNCYGAWALELRERESYNNIAHIPDEVIYSVIDSDPLVDTADYTHLILWILYLENKVPIYPQ